MKLNEFWGITAMDAKEQAVRSIKTVSDENIVEAVKALFQSYKEGFEAKKKWAVRIVSHLAQVKGDKICALVNDEPSHKSHGKTFLVQVGDEVLNRLCIVYPGQSRSMRIGNVNDLDKADRKKYSRKLEVTL